LVPTIVSMMIAAMVEAPSSVMTCSRCARARSVSCSGLSAWNDERYGYGPRKCATLPSEGSFAQRRGSPVSEIAVAVPPW
jgi:hypothetical protein